VRCKGNKILWLRFSRGSAPRHRPKGFRSRHQSPRCARAPRLRRRARTRQPEM